MDDFEEFKDRRAVIRDLSFASLIYYQLIHPSRSKSRGKRVCYGKACRDIGEQLAFSLRCVGSFFQKDDRGLL